MRLANQTHHRGWEAKLQRVWYNSDKGSAIVIVEDLMENGTYFITNLSQRDLDRPMPHGSDLDAVIDKVESGELPPLRQHPQTKVSNLIMSDEEFIQERRAYQKSIDIKRPVSTQSQLRYWNSEYTEAHHQASEPGMNLAAIKKKEDHVQHKFLKDNQKSENT